LADNFNILIYFTSIIIFKASIKFPNITPKQEVVAPPSQPKQESKTNMDLLGDLGGDFFASSAQAPAPTHQSGRFFL
jgi:hypothetical protein